MASSYYKLDISIRNETGTKKAKIARKKGFVPGILYYSGEKAISISIEKSTLLRAMNSGQRIFEIIQDGKSQYTMLKQVQYHPVTDEVIHIDLMRVRRSEKMTISVPIVLVGDAIGVKEGGEKLLVKNAEEYTSPVEKIYKVEGGILRPQKSS